MPPAPPFRPLEPRGFGGGLTGPVPRDLWILLGIVFVTFSLQFFASTAILPALFRLSPAVWRAGFLWQLATYPFIGAGSPSFWFLLELLIVFMFGKDVFYRLGRRRFWWLLVGAGVVAGVVAVLVQLLYEALGGGSVLAPPFVLMQGQHLLLTVLVAAFATLYRDATIYLLFVLPVQARWFLPLEIVFAFLGFLSTRDLAGFLGLCAAVGLTFVWLSQRPARGQVRDAWLRAQQWWFRRRLDRLRRKSGLRVVKDGGDSERDRYLH